MGWLLALYIACFIGAGACLYTIYQSGRTVNNNAAAQQPNDVGGMVTEVYTGTDLAPYIFAFGYMAAGAGPQLMESLVQSSMPTNPIGFTLQYGLSDQKKPWIVPGSPLAATPMTSDIINTTNQFTCTVRMPDGTLLYYSTTNMTMIITNGQRWFPTNGDISVFVPPTPVVIYRSTNLLSWTPLFSNNIPTNCVDIFTDTNPPPDSAYYRVGY